MDGINKKIDSLIADIEAMDDPTNDSGFRELLSDSICSLEECKSTLGQIITSKSSRPELLAAD